MIRLPTLAETVEFGRTAPCSPRRRIRPLRPRRLPCDAPPTQPTNAITLDQVLGSNIGQTSGFSGALTITTTQTAAAGSRIVACLSWFNTSALTPTLSDGSAYTLDKIFNNGSDHFAIFSRVLVGSLSSGASITVSGLGTGSPGGLLGCACSYLGTTGVDPTSSNSTTGTGLSSGAATNSVADALFVGGAGNETATTSVGGTNTNGTSRADIWNSGAGQGMRMLDLIASSVASQALTGTWNSSSTATTGALVIYKGTASASAPFGSPNLPFMAPQGGIL